MSAGNGDAHIGSPEIRDLPRKVLIVGAGKDEDGLAGFRLCRRLMQRLERRLGSATVIGVVATP